MSEQPPPPNENQLLAYWQHVGSQPPLPLTPPTSTVPPQGGSGVPRAGLLPGCTLVALIVVGLFAITRCNSDRRPQSARRPTPGDDARAQAETRRVKGWPQLRTGMTRRQVLDIMGLARSEFLGAGLQADWDEKLSYALGGKVRKVYLKDGKVIRLE